MIIKSASIFELDEILKIYSRAREYMKQTGNPNQWKDTNPTEEMVIDDIKNSNLYLLISEQGIEAVFAFIKSSDFTYEVIDSTWLNDEKYFVMHRVASAGKSKGVLKYCVDYCMQFCDNLRIDTHEDNKIMQHSLEKLGFKRCGIIKLLNGEPRIAYHLIKN